MAESGWKSFISVVALCSTLVAVSVLYHEHHYGSVLRSGSEVVRRGIRSNAVVEMADEGVPTWDMNLNLNTASDPHKSDQGLNEEVKQLPVHHPNLFRLNIPLSDAASTLNASATTTTTSTALSLRQLQAHSITALQISLPDGTVESFPFASKDTVLDLKTEIEKRLSIPVAEQKLTYQGEDLVDNAKTFYDLNIPRKACKAAWAYDASAAGSSACFGKDNDYYPYGWSNGPYVTGGCTSTACSCPECPAPRQEDDPQTCLGDTGGIEPCVNLTIYNWKGAFGPWDPWAGYVCWAMPKSEQLEVTIESATYFDLWEAHLWTGQDTANVPIYADGEAYLSAFPFVNTDLKGAQEHTFTVPLMSSAECQANGGKYELTLAAHALPAEPCIPPNGSYIWGTAYPAWGRDIDDVQESTDSTYTTFDIAIECDCAGSKVAALQPPEHHRRLPVADEDTCNCICPGDNKDDQATISMDLYLDATEGCEPEGESVGTVKVIPNGDGTIAEVTFTLKADTEQEMGATHLYVGKDAIPAEIPEDFKYSSEDIDITQKMYRVNLAELKACDFHVAAQAQLCSVDLDDTMELTIEPSSPTSSPTAEPGSYGDPHFVMWNGHKFDFHGACDLVLVDQPDFQQGRGLKIHLRTRMLRWWSYVEAAVVEIGEDTLEVKAGGFEKRDYWVNKRKGPYLTKHGKMPFTIGGNTVRFRILKNHYSWQFKILLDDNQGIVLRTMKDFLRVDIQHANAKTFGTARGLMGSFGSDAMLGRDGKTILDTANHFGLEWQVHHDEPMLFHIRDGIQHPNQCLLPNTVVGQEQEAKRRRLEGSISREAASAACAQVPESERTDCIFDVMATNDMDLAAAYVQ